jgi:hypothetical protein
MSEIVGLVGMSHSPFATMLPPQEPAQPGGTFLADAARVAKAVARLAPDAIVVVGPDHFHANFYDVMPPFVLGVEEAVGFGDFGSRSGPLPVATQLAWSVRDGLAGAGFDLSLSYSLTVDHGVVQSYEMVAGGTGIPLVPLIVYTVWDNWFLKQLMAADLAPITALGDERLEENAGSGAHEIRTWLIGQSAVRKPFVWTSYEPVPEWITGMGIGATFEVG